MTVASDLTGLGPGVYRGAITLQIQEDGSIINLGILGAVSGTPDDLILVFL
jgi:hypothetical protein